MSSPSRGFFYEFSFKCVRVFGFFLIDLLSHGDLLTPSQRLGHALNRELEGFQVQVQGEPPYGFVAILIWILGYLVRRNLAFSLIESAPACLCIKFLSWCALLVT